jgi:hypothetical protein
VDVQHDEFRGSLRWRLDLNEQDTAGQSMQVHAFFLHFSEEHVHAVHAEDEDS